MAIALSSASSNNNHNINNQAKDPFTDIVVHRREFTAPHSPRRQRSITPARNRRTSNGPRRRNSWSNGSSNCRRAYHTRKPQFAPPSHWAPPNKQIVTPSRDDTGAGAALDRLPLSPSPPVAKKTIIPTSTRRALRPLRLLRTRAPSRTADTVRQERRTPATSNRRHRHNNSPANKDTVAKSLESFLWENEGEEWAAAIRDNDDDGDNSTCSDTTHSSSVQSETRRASNVAGETKNEVSIRRASSLSPKLSPGTTTSRRRMRRRESTSGSATHQRSTLQGKCEAMGISF